MLEQSERLARIESRDAGHAISDSHNVDVVDATRGERGLHLVPHGRPPDSGGDRRHLRRNHAPLGAA
jgi:hypothetical protein